MRDLLDRRADEDGDAVFLVDVADGTAIDYALARARASAFADALAARGLRPGESVAYALGNGPLAALAVLGILYGGYRAVAVNLVAGADTVGYVLGHSRSRLVVTDEGARALVTEALAGASYREWAVGDEPPPMLDVPRWQASAAADAPARTAGSVGRARAGTPGADAARPPATPSRPDPPRADVAPSSAAAANDDVASDPENDTAAAVPTAAADALLMYTSGTTGRPKGVLLDHAALVAGARNVERGHGLRAADRALCVLPLYHINGLCVTLLAPLLSGGSVVLPPRFSASRFWRWIDAHRCSWFSVVPTQVSRLLHAEAAPGGGFRPRFGRSASAPLAVEVHRGFEERFEVPLIETMGLTETAAQILANPMPPGERRVGSPGRPVGVEIRVVDAALEPCAVGTEGELLVRGPCLMRRYFGDEGATREALTADGWLRTGDLARRDADGYVYITGRLKELIIRGGENIAPREIDEVLYTHPDVVEAAAFGRCCDDLGERVEAAVVLREDAAADAAALRAFCERRLGGIRVPERVHLLEVLPKGPSGKILRRRLSDICTS